MIEVTFAPPSREVAKPIVPLIQLSRNGAYVALFRSSSSNDFVPFMPSPLEKRSTRSKLG